MGHGQPLGGHLLRRQMITHSRVVPESREDGKEQIAAMITAKHPAPGNASFLEKTVAEHSKEGWHFTETMKGSKSNQQTKRQHDIIHSCRKPFFLAFIIHQGKNTNRNIEKGTVSTLQEFTS